MLANSLISLAAQHPPRSEVRFYVLDGIRADAPEVGLWNRVQQSLPHCVKISNPRGTPEMLALGKRYDH